MAACTDYKACLAKNEYKELTVRNSPLSSLGQKRYICFQAIDCRRQDFDRLCFSIDGVVITSRGGFLGTGFVFVISRGDSLGNFYVGYGWLAVHGDHCSARDLDDDRGLLS